MRAILLSIFAVVLIFVIDTYIFPHFKSLGLGYKGGYPLYFSSENGENPINDKDYENA